jgi:hypothetical protein
MRLSSVIINASFRSLIELNCLRSPTQLVLYGQHNLTHHGPYRPFGENQLSPGSLGILPLTTSHPMSLQRQRVRASHILSKVFTLLMLSSPGFGSFRYFKRATAEAGTCVHSHLVSLCLPPQRGVRLEISENSPAHSSIGTRSLRSVNECSSHGLFANSFRYYFIGCLTRLFTFPSRY